MWRLWLSQVQALNGSSASDGLRCDLSATSALLCSERSSESVHLFTTWHTPCAKLVMSSALMIVLVTLTVTSAVLGSDARTDDPLEHARALYEQGKYEEARETASAVEKPPELLRGCKLLVANCDRALKDYVSAIRIYRQLLVENEQDAVALDALLGLADSLQGTGDYCESENAIQRATRLYPDIRDAQLAERGSSFYSRNRAQYETAVDFARKRLQDLANTYAAADDSVGHLLVYRKLYLSFPYHPDARDTALKLAKLLSENDREQAAATYYLRVLDTGYDRCFSTDAKYRVNQDYLDTVSRAPSEDRIRTCLLALHQIAGYQLSEDKLHRYSGAWAEAVGRTYEPFSDRERSIWRTFSHEPFFGALCRLAIAKSYLRDGYYRQAISELDRIPRNSVLSVLRQRRMLLLAEAYMGLRKFTRARPFAAKGLAGPDRTIASRSRLLEARAAQMALDFEQAERGYRNAVTECAAEWDRKLAEFALKRVRELASLDVARPSRIGVLPDDRTTRGEWPLGYGREYHVLCAQNFVVDRTGGMGPELSYDLDTTSSEEPGRRWVTKRTDNDPAALWDPVVRTHKPANWDDHGEQEPIGSGPDLLITLDVPTGGHILSLYFVNDYNFYEPNRYYTISITDKSDQLLAVTDVEHFGGGVYKRFAIEGPIALDVRVWRNLSMNTLLSGVFLDPVPQMRMDAPLAADEGTKTTLRVIDRCEEINARIRCNPRWMPGQIGALDSLIADMEHDAAGLGLTWLLSEALQVRGHFRQSEASFGDYLCRAPECFPKEQIPDVYKQIAEYLIFQTGDTANGELVRRRWMKEGRHRWDRVYGAYFSTLAEQYEDSTSRRARILTAFAREHEEHPTAFAAVAAFRRAAELSPDSMARPVTLLQFARALDNAGRPREAIPVLQRLIRNDLSAMLRRETTWLLLRMQASAGVEADKIDTTYQSLVEAMDPTEQQRRGGLFLVAASYLSGGNATKARSLLQQYEQAYGTTSATAALLAQCEDES